MKPARYTLEFEGAALGDPWRSWGLVQVAEQIGASPERSLSAVCGGWGESMAAPQVTPEIILAPHQAALLNPVSCVAVILDTTELDVTPHDAPAGPRPAPR